MSDDLEDTGKRTLDAETLAKARPGATTQKLEELKAAALEAAGMGPDTLKGGKLENDDLLKVLLHDAEIWRVKHDREANERGAAVVSAIVSYQKETRADIAALKGRVGWLETHGVARVAMVLLILANILLGAHVWIENEQLKVENERLVMLRQSPVIRAEKTLAPQR